MKTVRHLQLAAEGNYCRKLTDSAPEWPSVAKFPPPDASVMPKNNFAEWSTVGKFTFVISMGREG
jgi:hypothetical protein